jgi:hypothetical protein
VFGDQCHGELSRSSAASDYVWKENTRVPGTPGPERFLVQVA